MRIIRVRYQEQVFYGVLEKEEGQEGTVTCLHGNMGFTGPIPLSELSLAPLVAPSKIICVGFNYRDHAAELNAEHRSEPGFFLKPPSSLIANGQAIRVPQGVGRVDHEAELAVVIGQACHKVNPDQVREYIFGYACANDVTARDLQKGEVMFGRCKGFDTFCPLGPWIETDLPPESAAVRALVNGEVRQQGTLGQMLFSPFELVSHISSVMTLLPGDVILTGTPGGIGPILPGDMVQVEIEGVGLLSNPVEADTGAHQG